MDELIKRLEAAMGPDRDLDYAIAEMVFPVLADFQRDGPGWYSPRDGKIAPPQAYTASVDAALSLWPDDGWPKIGKRRDHNNPEKTFYHAGFELGREPYYCGGSAATIPLAACIAALRARQP